LGQLPDFALVIVDAESICRQAIGAARHRMNLTVGDDIRTAVPEDLRPAVVQLLRQTRLGGETEIDLASSVTGYVHSLAIGPIPGRPGEVIIRMIDVTEERARRTSAETAQNRLRQLFEGAPNGFFVLDLDGIVVDANPALCALLGRDRNEMIGHRADLFGGRAELLQNLLRVLADSPTGRFAGETRMRHSDGHLVDVAFDCSLLSGPDGEPQALLINAVNVSERRRYEADLAYLAEHDPLTGLANRRRFDALLNTHLEHCERYGPRGALLMIDLDRFKQINDRLGHGAGDQLIIGTADLLTHRLRSTDIVTRLGGDEFAVLLPEADIHAAEGVAGDIVRIIREQASILDGTRPRRVTASIGVVMIDKPAVTATELMSTADMTMYDAKDSGRDRFVLLDTARYALPRTGAQHAWADRISDALTDDRFVLYAQPIQDLYSDRVVGAELLVRMIDEDGSLILPAKFLYIAERLGLVTQLDTWVTDQAVDLLAELHSHHPEFHLEVNLSGHSVGDPDLASRIKERVTDAHIDPHRLVFEITETAAVANIELARTFAHSLFDLGCRFALDDFGAGFGSFYYLKHLPFDYVKIDGEFVSHCTSSQTDRLILQSIVGIARGMGKRTIAEFVADDATLDVVRSHGVDFAQGYHIGRPIPVQELLAAI
jgi:diguanylate cyclase (GGDEF)-like protein/PAS domain S-box-containing protein